MSEKMRQDNSEKNSPELLGDNPVDIHFSPEKLKTAEEKEKNTDEEIKKEKNKLKAIFGGGKNDPSLTEGSKTDKAEDGKKELLGIYLEKKKKELKNTGKLAGGIGLGVAGGVAGFLAELPGALWKETKLISKILWKMAKGEKPPSFKEIWKTFFTGKKDKKE